MNILEPNHNLSFSNDFSLSSEFSSGIEYCQYEQQIDLSISLVVKEKQKTALSSKVKQILSKWKKRIDKYNCHLFDCKEDRLIEKSQSLLDATASGGDHGSCFKSGNLPNALPSQDRAASLIKKISTETAWVSSLLALTSIGLVSEIVPIWSEVNQNLAFKLPFLKTTIALKSSTEKLFPLLAIEEISLIIGDYKFGNWQSKKPNRTNTEDYDFGLSPPKNDRVARQKWLMYQTNSNGSLMAIPPLYDRASVAGFPSLLSTLDFINFQKDFNLNQFNLLNKNKLPDRPADSVTYDIEDKLMATPKAVYQPYLPQVNFLKRN